MKVRPLWILGVGLSTGVMVAAVWGQSAKPAATQVPAAPTASQNGNVIIRNSPQGTGIYDDTTGIAQLTKNVTVVQTGEDFILYAQKLTYNRPKNQATATGNLRVETRDSTIRAANIFADFNTKIIRFSGSVVVSTHGKSDGITGNRKGFRAQLSQKSSQIACDRADWDYEARQAVLTGNLNMKQEQNVGTCERIIYDERQNIAQLQGRVRFTDNKKRTFNTPDLTIYIDEGRMVTNQPMTLKFGSDWAPSTTPRPTNKPMAQFPSAPKISDDDAKLFGVTPPPIPTPRPEPTEAPTPPTETPAENA